MFPSSNYRCRPAPADRRAATSRRNRHYCASLADSVEPDLARCSPAVRPRCLAILASKMIEQCNLRGCHDTIEQGSSQPGDPAAGFIHKPMSQLGPLPDGLTAFLTRAHLKRKAKLEVLDVDPSALDGSGVSGQLGGNGRLGRIYKDRWKIAYKEGRPETRSLLRRAIDTYRQGFRGRLARCFGIGALARAHCKSSLVIVRLRE